MVYDPAYESQAHYFYTPDSEGNYPSVGDGKTYSNALGWQSPEGNFYGQERWVRDWYSSVVWNGEDYILLEPVGNAVLPSLFPIPGNINPATGLPYGSRQDFEIWSTPRPNWPPTDLAVYDGRSKDYYFWDVDSQSWQEIEWFFTCDGEDELPRPGIKRGSAHNLIYHDIKVMWNGYYWKLYDLEMLEGGERVKALEGLTELTTGQITQIQIDHNELVESFFGYAEVTNQQLIDNTKFATLADRQLEAYITEIINNITSFSQDSAITASEANSLELALNHIKSESIKVTAVASELGVVSEKEAYNSALENLETELEIWLDKSYPLDIVAQDKIDILFSANELKDIFDELHLALQEEFDGTIVDYTVEQLQDVSEAISDVNDDVAEFSSDGFITFVESKALKISFEQLDAESVDIVAIASGLEADLEVVWAEKTAYINALGALEIELGKWVGLAESSYPVIAVAQDRTNITDALRLVKSTRDTLAKKIRDADVDYVDAQIGDVNEAIGILSDDILEFSDDGFITFTESISLKTALNTLTEESIDLVAVANSLGITTEKTNYSTSLSNLSNSITPWIDLVQSAYPAVVTTNQRNELLINLDVVQRTKSILVNEIIRKRQEDVSKYVNNQISDANSSLTALRSEWDNRLSDSSITYAEAASLRLVMSQFLAEVDALQVIADGVNKSAEGLSYKNAALALTSGINALINDTYTYPVVVSLNQKSVIVSLFDTCTSTKKALIDVLTITTTYGVGGIGFDVTQFRTVFNGLIRGFTPELKLVFVSSNELSLQPNYTDYSYLTVNEQNIQASGKTSVFSQTPVLAWSDITQTFTQSSLEADTPYWVYLANRNDCFNIESGSIPYDYRGRLFCSGTEPSNNYLGESGDGLNAILVGRAQTHASEVKFLHEYGVSYISRTSDLKETFREYSDFDLIFVDSDTLRLQQNYGSYGQIYIPEGVYYIGDDREVYTTSTRIELSGDGLIFDYTAIAANQTYYVYIAGDLDLYNNNYTNEVTNRPWHPEDSDPTPSLYDADKDLRLYLFLSTQVPDNGRLSETYNGFWTRWVGIIQTDDNGKFKYAGNISVIRQPTLNPSDLDGMANISLVRYSNSSFRIVKKAGTNGCIYVGGRPIYTYEDIPANSNLIHIISINDYTKIYTESNVSSPLSDSTVVANTVVEQSLYVYLANDRSFWGETASKLFFSTLAPTGGYLSQNWPGNNARWLCTVQLAPATYGSELVGNPTFSTTASWTWGTGWTHDSNDLKADHTTPDATAALSQGITIVAGAYYELIASTRDRTVGGVNVTLGGTLGQLLWSNTSVRQYLIATDTTGLYFTPNENFDGSVDSVYCKRVITGQLIGSYVIDSIGFGSATINDSVVSYNESWSSSRIMEELNKLATQFGLSSDASEQGQSGLPLLLEYYSSTQVKLTCTNALPVVVVFPDLSTIEINSTGILGTVTGSIDTTYYIYIDKDGLCSASTTAPDVTYPNKKTLGDTKILVGYAAFSSTNTLSGDWNVCSYWNEPTREWVSPTIDSENFTFTKSGLIIPPSGQATVSRTGVTTITGTACGYSPTWDTFCTVSATISASLGSVNGNLPSSTTYGYYSNIAPYGPWPYVFDRNVQIPAGVDNVTVSINTGITLAEGVYNSIILTATKSVLSTATYCCADGFLQYANTSAGYHINSFTARSGNLYITRQGNIV